MIKHVLKKCKLNAYQLIVALFMSRLMSLSSTANIVDIILQQFIPTIYLSGMPFWSKDCFNAIHFERIHFPILIASFCLLFHCNGLLIFDSDCWVRCLLLGVLCILLNFGNVAHISMNERFEPVLFLHVDIGIIGAVYPMLLVVCLGIGVENVGATMSAYVLFKQFVMAKLVQKFVYLLDNPRNMEAIGITFKTSNN